MKYAIIAAGEGSRLASEGISVPKPLVRVGGEPLVDRLLRIFLHHGATEVDVICNDLTKEVSAHLRQKQQEGLPLKVVVKTTPSSMHSLFELSGLLGNEPFCLTTVDTIFREKEFGEYVARFQSLLAHDEADGLMGVTDYIDDEKPLHVVVDGEMNVTAFLDSTDCPCYISGGIYGLTPKSLQTLQRCIARRESRMRNFQRALVNDGLRLKAWPFSKVLDIDHAEDIQKAENFLAE